MARVVGVRIEPMDEGLLEKLAGGRGVAIEEAAAAFLREKVREEAFPRLEFRASAVGPRLPARSSAACATAARAKTRIQWVGERVGEREKSFGNTALAGIGSLSEAPHTSVASARANTENSASGAPDTTRSSARR